MQTKIRRYKLKINGIVQGVGFRPFVHNLAKSFDLHGYVRNTSNGVDIEIQGIEENLNLFFSQLLSNHPPLAQITDFQKSEIPLQNSGSFSILKSEAPSTNLTHIPPDIAICAECLSELFDVNNRRFRYPFINCTNCGPRYSIVSDVPYDRQFTSMASFILCPECEKEFHHPGNRRFHAQPNACPDCGPWVTLSDKSGTALDATDPVTRTSELLLQGAIIAVKGLGGFHLMCDADNNDAVQLLRERKHREAKPFAVMASRLEYIESFAYFSQNEAQLLTAPQRPIVLLRQKGNKPLAGAISPDTNTYGVMLAYTPLHYLRLEEQGVT